MKERKTRILTVLLLVLLVGCNYKKVPTYRPVSRLADTYLNIKNPIKPTSIYIAEIRNYENAKIAMEKEGLIIEFSKEIKTDVNLLDELLTKGLTDNGFWVFGSPENANYFAYFRINQQKLEKQTLVFLEITFYPVGKDGKPDKKQKNTSSYIYTKEVD